MPLSLLCLLIAVAPRVVFGQTCTLSESKLSVHQLTSYTTGAQQIVRAHPRVLKVMGIATGPPLQAAREYKTATPDGVVVLREYTDHRYAVTEDPAVAARHFWDTVLAPPLNLLSPQDRALIDYVEGPNEGDSTPTWGNAEDTIWFNDFWMTLAPLIADAGFKPCAFSISVGNPPGSIQEIHASLDRIVPALRLVKGLGGAWSYHSYTIPYTTNPGTEIWYSLRYRMYYDYFADNHPDLIDLPLVLTEGGVDGQISPDGAGWQGGGDAEKYKNWLTWYDQQIRQDDYVLGVTLFQSGSPGWASFEVEPIAGWLADHLSANCSVPGILLSRTEFSHTLNQGASIPDESFTVANSGDGTLNYAISDNASWLSITPTAGTSDGAAATHIVSYDVAGLGEGTHNAVVTVTDDRAANSPQQIMVELTVEGPRYVGDFDYDDDVDQSDFGFLQGCLTGAGAPLADPMCRLADLNGDSDVDNDDYGLFQACVSGANAPPLPRCLN